MGFLYIEDYADKVWWVCVCVCVLGAAAVAYEPNKPFTFEDIYVAPPGPNEVRIKMTNAAMCQSDLYYLKGKVSIIISFCLFSLFFTLRVITSAPGKVK